MPTLISWLDAASAFLRSASIALLAIAALLATLSWAARTRRISPFTPLARFVRTRIDPLFAALERRLARSGVPAANAPWWALLGVLVGSAFLIWVIAFVRDAALGAYLASNAGPRGLIVLAIRWTCGVLQLALLIRVITMWVGGAYSAVGRLAFRLTEWFLGPLRRALPTIGPVDISPMVAWLGLMVIAQILIRFV